jgi:tetratricopeptide (TPR) repeat protein
MGPEQEVSMATRTVSPIGPIVEFCSALNQLRIRSGRDPRKLIPQLGVGRTQFYAILHGDIKRPPDWTTFVGPLVEACTGGDARAVAAWRQRHALLVEVCEELNRQQRRPSPVASPGEGARGGPVASPRPHAAVARGRNGLVPPRQLPAHTPYFVGRTDELRALNDWLAEAAGARPETGRAAGTVPIVAIGGTAGIGKTTLALRWAHQVADQFPDGQLYVNLRGFDPARPPMEPGEAVRGFLAALGVEPGRVPGDPDSQGALYRSMLAERRILVLLDNARDSGQVRPLLPGSETCLAITTSRNQLGGLIAQEGAHQLSLDLLGAGEARELLTRRLGSDRVACEPDAADELTRLCARLPLALSVVAARAVAQPAFSLGRFAGELGDIQERLEALDAGDLTANVRAVLSWSYEQLDPPVARLFRLLGIHPGPDISLPAAASLAGLDRRQARSAMAALAQACLVTEHPPGRFAFHDLLRAYAQQLAREEEPADHREAALSRVLDHYLHTACLAARLLDPAREPLTLDPPEPGVTPEALPALPQAREWFKAEQAVLIAAIDHAAEDGFDRQAWQLAWTLSNYLDRTGQWPDWAATQRAAIGAARRLGSAQAEARSQRYLARAYVRLGRFAQARLHLKRALQLYAQVGDLTGQGHTYVNLALVRERESCYGEALNYAQQAFGLFHAVGYLRGQADALNNTGWYHALMGQHEEALASCEQALVLYQELGDSDGQAGTWDSIGFAQHHLGRYEQAIGCFECALDLYRKLSDRYAEADVLIHLGDTHLAMGIEEAARQAWEDAVVILRQIGHEDADKAQAKLDSLGQAQ